MLLNFMILQVADFEFPPVLNFWGSRDFISGPLKIRVIVFDLKVLEEADFKFLLIFDIWGLLLKYTVMVVDFMVLQVADFKFLLIFHFWGPRDLISERVVMSRFVNIGISLRLNFNYKFYFNLHRRGAQNKAAKFKTEYKIEIEYHDCIVYIHFHHAKRYQTHQILSKSKI